MISGVLYSVPKNPKNHQRGFSEIWSELLDAPLNVEKIQSDVFYCDHGANFTGGPNIMGGFARWFDNYKLSFDMFLEAKEIYSLGRDMPPLGEWMRARKDTAPLDDKYWDAVTAQCEKSKTIHMWDIPNVTKLAIGDSHTPSYSASGSAVIKKDGTTLFGSINSNFEWYDENINKFKNLELITLSIGNIDVRHHFLRHEPYSWKQHYDHMLKYMDRLSQRVGCEVELSLPYPIEHEERNLPGTGLFKGTPFYGSIHERKALVRDIRDYLSRDNTVSCPIDWYYIDPAEYAKEKMEQAGRTASVHLSPLMYRRKDWGIPKSTLESFYQ